ncbi:MAG: FprA family A-type flavoprotein [Bacilli bacterium]|nr:FprA family A-type flavoprotein [Bacillales bacterium]MDY2575213.1 FprA family A-type flavoprotein [Bacilli bacterium]
MKITKDIKYIGVNDHDIDLFEGQYVVENGMAYNSYLIMDEKIAILDTVEARFSNEWLTNIKNELNGRTPNFLVVQHMEPDHSSNIVSLLKEYPNIKIVSSSKAFQMMKNFYGDLFANNSVVVNEGDTLSLGKHTLTFITAPMVHWPEVIMTYDQEDKVVFSADAFGKFGALDVEEEWACEARRYYFGIVGKYGMQVQNVLKKLAKFEINAICPLHGPVLSENLGYYLNLYNTWSSYQAEEEGIVIAYTSVYGNTKKAVMTLADKLRACGKKVVVNDLARTDMAEDIEDAFRYNHLILATTTYNADIFPFMRTFIEGLVERNYQNRTISLIENGSWAPMAVKVMTSLLEKCKNIKYTNTLVRITSALNQDSLKQIDDLVEEIKSL